MFEGIRRVTNGEFSVGEFLVKDHLVVDKLKLAGRCTSISGSRAYFMEIERDRGSDDGYTEIDVEAFIQTKSVRFAAASMADAVQFVQQWNDQIEALDRHRSACIKRMRLAVEEQAVGAKSLAGLPSDDDLRLHMGELNKDEILIARSAYRLGASGVLKDRERR